MSCSEDLKGPQVTEFLIQGFCALGKNKKKADSGGSELYLVCPEIKGIFG